MNIVTGSATEVRDLRTGTPVWAGYKSSEISSERLLQPMKADVVVVGAGITGALVAEAASASGLATVVLDRRTPGHGSTYASTALVQFEIDTPLIRLAEDIGFERASRLWRRSFRAVDDLASLIRSLRIRCDFRARSALYLAGITLGVSELAEEGRQRRAIGLPSAFLEHKDLRSLTGIEREAALLSNGVADVNPVGLTHGLLRRAMARGTRVFCPVQLAEVVPSGRKVAMIAANGIELEAGALVFATGYELAHGVPSAGHRRSNTWAFATPPQPRALWSKGELIWEASEPYLYIRTTAEGRVVIGGEDEDVEDENARDALLSLKTAALQKKTKELMPWLDVSADFAWAGTFGESDNGVPSMGTIPGMTNCYAVLGYGGNGLTFGVIAAQIVVGQLCGRPDVDADLFAFRC
jgi:glycine/D-amino acid oxidase-like deaminating enzyme